MLAGCYAHNRPDAPTAPPSAAASPMISVPSGSFTMGDQNGEPDEYPERQISVAAFRIDRAEVSNAAYRLCVRAKACDPGPHLDDPELGRDEHPVVGVTWEDARRFCAWVKKRLPTEAEWEYAAKGTDHRKWPWVGAFAAERANTAEGGIGSTRPVVSQTEGESPFGVLHMAGNAAEWVADYFDPTFYRTSKATQNPTGPEAGRERVVRGGSFRDTSHLVRVSARRAKLPTEIDNTVGFRCAAD